MRGKRLRKRVHRNIELHRDVEDGAHARAHHLAVVQVHAVGAAEAAEISEPRQRAQDGAEIAGILDLVKIDRAFALARRGGLEQRHHRGDALR